MRAALNGDGFPRRSRPANSCYESPLVPIDEALRAYGAQSFTPGRPILAAARELTSAHQGRLRIPSRRHRHLARRCTRCSRARRASARTSPMSMIAALRAHGLAARLRLGLHPHRPLPRKRSRCAAATPATPGSRCGAASAAGWVHLDPTNDLVASQDHVAVAWGRDFSDVSPLRGVILGGDAHTYGGRRDAGSRRWGPPETARTFAIEKLLAFRVLPWKSLSPRQAQSST